MSKLSYQYWKGVSVGLLLTAIIFTIPIIASIFYPIKYFGLTYLIINYILGIICLVYMKKEQKQRSEIK